MAWLTGALLLLRQNQVVAGIVCFPNSVLSIALYFGNR